MMERLKVEHPDGGLGSTSSSSPRHRRLTFARLATCVLNVERARKRTSRAREEELLQAAETGDVSRLRTLLALGRDINIDCTDQLGRTPLHLAVVNEQKDAVRFLLEHVEKRRVYQALLSAINLGNEEIAEIIIEHHKYEEISTELKENGRAYFYLNKFNDDNQFSEEITPLILAAQQNRFEVVMALLLKGETIEKPHRCHCICGDCAAMARRDELKFARSRLNSYKAMASEAYISLSSEDPILTSFDLRKELCQVSREEKYYTAEYSGLANQLGDYVVRLLDKVHGNEELNAILNASPDMEDTEDLLRLQLAIKLREKKFVAHPSCQKKLTTLWYQDFHKVLQHRSGSLQTVIIISIVFLYPFLAFIYFIAPHTKVGKLLRTPIIKFIAQATSYLFFLGIIVLYGHIVQGKLCTTKLEDLAEIKGHFVTVQSNLTGYLKTVDLMCVRNHKPALMEALIVLWILGLCWQACKQVYEGGLRSHLMDIYNAMDYFMLKFYIASLTLAKLTDINVQYSLRYFKKIDSWKRLLRMDNEALYNLYWLNADRFYWDAWDPVHVCEALFAVGNILNFARLFHLLAIHEHLGPMLISLERMIKDVMKFFLTYVPIMVAFMVGMYNLYWYYNPFVRGHVEITKHNITTNAEKGFGNLELTFRTIFWALFGLKDPRTVELGNDYQGRFTESVGYIVFGVYNWGAVIVLLNMLIAMMTRSFDKIATYQDIEWKYVRSKLYMEYIKQGSTLPVPFNIFPTPKSVVKQAREFSHWLRSLCCRRQRTLDEENAPYFAMNGGMSLLIGNKNGAVGSDVTPEAETSASRTPRASEAFTPKKAAAFDKFEYKNKRSIFSRMKSEEDDANDNDYKAVIKRVVRRYIFEHLLASVVPNEGSIDLENIKQQASGIQSDLTAMKPKIHEEFRQLREEFRSMSTNMDLIKAQLGLLMRMCGDLQETRTGSEQSQSERSSVAEDMMLRSTPLSASSEMGILVSRTPDALSAGKDSDTEMLI